MTELYALIRPASSYADQDTGVPFRVKLNPCPFDGYYWIGGPGGQYRHSDLILFVKDGDEFIKCRAYAANGEREQIIRMMLTEIQTESELGYFYPDKIESWVNQQRKQLSKILKIAKANRQEDI